MTDKGFVVRKTFESARLFEGNPPLLPHIDIELTERCNNSCIHCYINLPENDSNAKNRELSTDQLKDILDQSAALGALSVRFSGGEPLLRKDFSEIYLHARRLGMKVKLFTNARLITDELADLFGTFRLLNKIEISVYGMHKDSYEAVTRVKGSYDEFRKGVDRLLDREIPIILKFVPLPPNRNDREEFVEWIADLPGKNKPTYMSFLMLRTRRDSEDKNKLIKRLRSSIEEQVAFFVKHKTEYCNNMPQYAEKFFYLKGSKLFKHCGAGETVTIDAYGQCQMCMLLRHPEMSFDATKNTLRDIITKVFPRLRETEAYNQNYLRRCAKCFLLGFCDQCPGYSWSEHGTLDTPVEYLCQVTHAHMRLLGLLKEGESAWEVADWKERVDNLVNQLPTA
ncbi:MAG: radical SAM protein [Desulfotignum sp.]|nr:radical SAM protein [Desulfotignum sp.]